MGMAAISGGAKHAAGHVCAPKQDVPTMPKQAPQGGGAGPDLSGMLEALKAAVAALGAALPAATQVAGVQGAAATPGAAVLAPVASTSGSEDHDFEARVLQLINAERAAAGLAPVRYNSTLDSAAEGHASHMATVGAMAHRDIGDGDPASRIRIAGFADAWGENVATGQTSPEQVVREWMASPTHRRNIMDPNFRQMGVSYTTAANGRSYWAQEFGA